MQTRHISSVQKLVNNGSHIGQQSSIEIALTLILQCKYLISAFIENDFNILINFSSEF